MLSDKMMLTAFFETIWLTTRPKVQFLLHFGCLLNAKSFMHLIIKLDD